MVGSQFKAQDYTGAHSFRENGILARFVCPLGTIVWVFGAVWAELLGQSYHLAKAQNEPQRYRICFPYIITPLNQFFAKIVHQLLFLQK
jgi:hypothetical protein